MLVFFNNKKYILLYNKNTPVSIFMLAGFHTQRTLLKREPYMAEWTLNIGFSNRWVTALGAMAELADATDLKSVGSDTLWVRFPLAPFLTVFASLLRITLGGTRMYHFEF